MKPNPEHRAELLAGVYSNVSTRNMSAERPVDPDPSQGRDGVDALRSSVMLQAITLIVEHGELNEEAITKSSFLSTQNTS